MSTAQLHYVPLFLLFVKNTPDAKLEVLFFPISQVLGTAVNKPVFTLFFSAFVYSSADEEITKHAILKLT